MMLILKLTRRLHIVFDWLVDVLWLNAVSTSRLLNNLIMINRLIFTIAVNDLHFGAEGWIIVAIVDALLEKFATIVSLGRCADWWHDADLFDDFWATSAGSRWLSLAGVGASIYDCGSVVWVKGQFGCVIDDQGGLGLSASFCLQLLFINLYFRQIKLSSTIDILTIANIHILILQLCALVPNILLIIPLFIKLPCIKLELQTGLLILLIILSIAHMILILLILDQEKLRLVIHRLQAHFNLIQIACPSLAYFCTRHNHAMSTRDWLLLTVFCTSGAILKSIVALIILIILLLLISLLRFNNLHLLHVT